MLRTAASCYRRRTLVPPTGIGARLAPVILPALAVLLLAVPVASAPPGPGAVPPSVPTVAEPAASLAPLPAPSVAGNELAALRESVAALQSRVDALGSGESPPPWATALQEQLGQRVERVMEMQERLAARIETPLPRLDEPIILFTVAASTLVLGFVVGRGLQRRRDRRDGRFRL